MARGVFIDRDGVINEVMTKRVRHVNSPENFFFLEGALEGLKMLTAAGYELFVVTNQGGVGLGYLKEETLIEIHEQMMMEITKSGGFIREIAYCSHKPHEGCYCRKPNPGMILDLAKKYEIDRSQSYMIGDRETDIEAGTKAGLSTIKIGDLIGEADYLASSMLEAAQYIVSKDARK